MTCVNVKWKVLMGSDWWSWHINSSWAVWWNGLSTQSVAFYFHRMWREKKKKKKMLNILCEGSLEDLFHVYPAVTANFLPVISLLLLIYSWLISGGLSRDDNLGLTAGMWLVNCCIYKWIVGWRFKDGLTILSQLIWMTALRVPNSYFR